MEPVSDPILARLNLYVVTEVQLLICGLEAAWSLQSPTKAVEGRCSGGPSHERADLVPLVVVEELR
jgi:hypothetical protein